MDIGHSVVLNASLSPNAVDVQVVEAGEFVEEGLVGGSHGHLELGQLWGDSKESHLLLHDCHS